MRAAAVPTASGMVAVAVVDDPDIVETRHLSELALVIVEDVGMNDDATMSDEAGAIDEKVASPPLVAVPRSVGFSASPCRADVTSLPVRTVQRVLQHTSDDEAFAQPDVVESGHHRPHVSALTSRGTPVRSEFLWGSRHDVPNTTGGPHAPLWQNRAVARGGPVRLRLWLVGSTFGCVWPTGFSPVDVRC